MNKTGKIVIIFILSVLVIFGIYKTIELMTVDTKENVKVIRYKSVYPDVHKTYKITSELEKRRIMVYVKNIKPLTDKEMVQLSLMKDIEIQYGKNITIGIQEGEKSYCYYENKKENIHKLARIPRGLYNLVMKKVNDR